MRLLSKRSRLALRRRRRLRAGLAQLVYMLIAFVLALKLPDVSIWFTVSSSEAIDALLAVGIGMVAFIGLVYSLLFLVVQFGATTFTPRLNLFRDSRIVWNAFGFYVGVIVFSLTAAFTIDRDVPTSGLVPIALTVNLLVTIVLFRALQTAAFRSLELAATLAQVRKRGRQVIAEVHPAGFETGVADSAGSEGLVPEEIDGIGHDVLWRGDSEVLQVIDLPGLVLTATNADVFVELPLAPGETVGDGNVVAVVHGAGDADGRLDEQVIKALTLGLERTFEQDPRFALRVLADIALRALSPAINDPSTATQTLDSLDDLLRMLLSRNLGPGRATDTDGVTRVAFTLPDWDEYVGLALDEIISFGADSSQVRARLDRLLVDLIAVAPPARRFPLESRLLELRGLGRRTAPGRQAEK